METCLFYMEGFCTGSRDSFYRMDLCAIPKSSGSLMLNKAFVLSDLILLPAEGPKANNLCLFLCDKEYDTCITEMSKMTLEGHWFIKKIISEGIHCLFANLHVIKGHVYSIFLSFFLASNHVSEMRKLC